MVATVDRTRRNLITATVLVILLIAAIAAALQFANPFSGGTSSVAPETTTQATPVSGLPTTTLAQLPKEAAAVLALIDEGGPFRYEKDGSVFGNFEGLLPQRARGYYREYTVPTPGSRDRGARRLVVGQDGDVYYTADHYESFHQVLR